MTVRTFYALLLTWCVLAWALVGLAVVMMIHSS
jgi:hypothetical protein